MNKLLKYKNRIIIAVGIVIVLAVSFWWGGNSSSLHGWSVDNAKHPVKTAVPTNAPLASSTTASPIPNSASPMVLPTATANPSAAPTLAGATPQPTQGITHNVNSNTAPNTSNPQSTPVATTNAEHSKSDSKYGKLINPSSMPKPVDEQVIQKDKHLKCTLSVSCKTAIEYKKLSDELRAVLPANGEIYYKKNVDFYKGESAFDILKRELTNANIHLEFNYTPMYNSVYIEGINNLYEFDCGELSGWMYKVNDWFPNYGASRYEVQDGDVINWLYTCDLGFDVGCTYISE